MLDKILEKYGLKYGDLEPEEKETLNVWMSALEQGQLTIEKIRDYIVSMRANVEQEVTKTDLNTKQDLLLKARLRNYLLLEAFLSSPEKARKQLEESISHMKGKGVI